MYYVYVGNNGEVVVVEIEVDFILDKVVEGVVVVVCFWLYDFVVNVGDW